MGQSAASLALALALQLCTATYLMRGVSGERSFLRVSLSNPYVPHTSEHARAVLQLLPVTTFLEVVIALLTSRHLSRND